MHSLLRASVLGLSLAIAACGGRSGSRVPTPDSSTSVRIENRSSYDMDIYLRRTFDGPTRVGFVPASETIVIPLGRALTAGSAAFRLEARPARRAGSSVLSDPFSAEAGEAIFWSIPPQEAACETPAHGAAYISPARRRCRWR
jgi:hypothetical protein